MAVAAPHVAVALRWLAAKIAPQDYRAVLKMGKAG
jgi:hypothetical protein